jgi:O2-independent ubiquinone biosynthesis accessory factor UbiT
MSREGDPVLSHDLAEAAMLRFPEADVIAALVAEPLRLVPHSWQQQPLEYALEQLFGTSIAAGELDFLEGRCLAILIEDTGWRWPIALANGRLRILERGHPADVTIRGCSPAFLIMAGRFDDPDTLFFQRRLVIEGDTELGLGVKNFLDGLDEERLPWPMQLAFRMGTLLKRAF